MIAKVKSFIMHGVEAVPVTVECEVSAGIGIHVVGLADSAGKECLLRTVTAMQAQGYHLPGKKVVVNIRPDVAGRIVAGCGLDLPVALAILSASGQAPAILSGDVFAGELALDGSLRAVTGDTCALVMAARNGLKTLVLPAADAARAVFDAGSAACGVTTYAVRTLAEAVALLSGEGGTLAQKTPEYAQFQEQAAKTYRSVVVGTTELRLAAEVAAAGAFPLAVACEEGVDIDLVSAGTLLSQLLIPGDAVEKACIHAAARHFTPKGVPVYAISPEMSTAAIAGGGHGAFLTPGYVTLAHGGVLVLSHAEAFPKSRLEMLQHIHEDGAVTLARLHSSVTMPAAFRPVVVYDATKGLPAALREMFEEGRYVHVTLRKEDLRQITEDELAAARERVAKASPTDADVPNARIEARDVPKDFGPSANRLVQLLIQNGRLSARYVTQLWRVARTVADLEGNTGITPDDYCTAAEISLKADITQAW